MKQLLSFFLIAASLTIAAQPKKAQKMAPVLASGYYVGSKNDTVRGEVQTNPEDETAFYTGFNFKPAKGGKVMPVDSKKAKAYGFDGKHFILIPNGDGNVYVERLAEGRLNFFEYRYNGKIDGYPAIVSDYFAQDTRAEGEDLKLKEITKISTKFYKRDLKPFMKDQPMIWSDFDKFTFNKQAVVNGIIEFNKYYVISAD
jgi:hypothetical protein